MNKSHGEGEKDDPFELDSDERRKCDEAFSAFDKDNSGKIDVDEIKLVMEMMGQSSTDEEIFTLISTASPTNKGTITKQQFRRLMAD